MCSSRICLVLVKVFAILEKYLSIRCICVGECKISEMLGELQ